MQVITTIVSIVLLLWSSAAKPTHAQCPVGWYVDGAQPSGVFSCAKTPPRDVCDSKAGCGAADQEPDPHVTSRLYCTGGTVPIVALDGRSVGCQRAPRE